MQQINNNNNQEQEQEPIRNKRKYSEIGEEQEGYNKKNKSLQELMEKVIG
jgi:hypothetical protein